MPHLVDAASVLAENGANQARCAADGAVLSVQAALSHAACETLRRAVDDDHARGFGLTADSADGAADHQLAIRGRAQLEALIGGAATRHLWSLAQDYAGQSAADEATEIFIRRYTPWTRPFFGFHQDRAAFTINVALSDDAADGSGRLLAIMDGTVHGMTRLQGDVTVHASSLMHGVARLCSGVRYALIVFLGQEATLLGSEAEAPGLALFDACESGDGDSVRRCLAAGADVDAREPGGVATPLLLSCEVGNDGCVRLLLEHRATVDLGTAEGDGATPLYISCQAGHQGCVELLLHARANVDRPLEAGGASPLYISAQEGHAGCMRLLLAAGAQTGLRLGGSGSTALEVAHQEGHQECVELLRRWGR